MQTLLPSSFGRSERTPSRWRRTSSPESPALRHSTQRQLRSGRRHTRSRWSRSMTEARTRMGMKNEGLLVSEAGWPTPVSERGTAARPVGRSRSTPVDAGCERHGRVGSRNSKIPGSRPLSVFSKYWKGIRQPGRPIPPWVRPGGLHIVPSVQGSRDEPPLRPAEPCIIRERLPWFRSPWFRAGLELTPRGLLEGLTPRSSALQSLGPERAPERSASEG